MRLFAWIVLAIAWVIPGPPHRWARRLLAERRAARSFRYPGVGR